MKTMTSKFKGTCRKCGGNIAKGSEIKWSKETGAMHLSCSPDQPNQQYSHEDYPCSDLGYEDACARACGFGGFGL